MLCQKTLTNQITQNPFKTLRLVTTGNNEIIRSPDLLYQRKKEKKFAESTFLLAPQQVVLWREYSKSNGGKWQGRQINDKRNGNITNKHITIKRGDTTDTLAIAQIKPAFLEDPQNITNSATPLFRGTPTPSHQQTWSGRKVTFPSNLRTDYYF